MLGDRRNVIVVIMLVMIVLIMAMAMVVMAMPVMIMVVVIMVIVSVLIVTMLIVAMGFMVMRVVVMIVGRARSAGRFGGGAHRGSHSPGNVADRSVRGLSGIVGDGLMMLARGGARFIGCALVSLARHMAGNRGLGEAVRLRLLGRLGMRLIGMIVINVSVGLMRLVVGLMGFGVRGLAAVDGLDDLALDPLAAAAAPRAAVPVAPAVGAVLTLFLGLAVGALLGLDQRLPVGDRNLIVVGMDFAERQEAMAVAAILDEGGLQRRLNTRDLRQVDVAAELLALGSLEVKFLDAVAADDNDPGLFRVGSIDQHLVGHIGTLGGDGRDWPRARGALSDDATVHLIRG
ncbi:hypothetical protein SSBR45G_01500 [Bradyrhizobium sp. SSBR45G]|nr:hypothetical protein SSBR45G_01500 [Bradyrhizobium sp. SSBR45G]GLH82971.1 hypothetical protein SSBR45R_04310 [Bradyrhizobium sp. SSBR45R]